jgi:hypothetical protein
MMEQPTWKLNLKREKKSEKLKKNISPGIVLCC